MKKTILLTGATDGIGLETAKMLARQGHHLLLHGRNPDKLKAVSDELSALPGAGMIETHQADFSHLDEIKSLAAEILAKHSQLDVLINNAGVFNTPDPLTPEGLDLRFVVNTIAPYLLTQLLLPLMPGDGRVVNLSSAAQAPVDLDALAGKHQLDAGSAYAQSKLALTMWSRHLGLSLENGPLIVAVNPGSLLGSKMVKEGYGIDGGDLGIGADILTRAALSEEFATANGKYYDNDARRFAAPHPDALDDEKCEEVISAIQQMLSK